MTTAATRGEAVLALYAAVTMLLALAPGALAGSAEDPEITDVAGDGQDSFLGVIPVGSAFDPLGIAAAGDLVAAWVEEDSTNLTFVAQVNGDLEGTLGSSGLAGEGVLADYRFLFSVTFNGLVKDLITTVDVDGTHPDAGLFAVVEGSTIRLIAPRDFIDAEAADLDLAFSVLATCRTTGVGSPAQIITGIQTLITDRAPDEGYGRNYTTQVALGGTLNDTDADGLDDSFEMEHFGDLTSANGTGDNDNDGLNNSQEATRGTDPTKFDTDGDGLSDKADEFPLDPTKPVDADGDGLNDTWERGYYNQTSRYNGTDDPDKDNRTNLQEQANGTNPLKGDTDGDGVRDDRDAFPTDATKSAAPGSGSNGAGDSTGSGDTYAKPELYSGVAMFAAAATFCLLGLARGL